ncbi:MAG: DinB family protein [SAR202 cluster bacterium]|nr:DinB family protein [SAR202 cluster bacterium]
MTSNEAPAFAEFVAQLMERSHRRMLQAVDGLSNAQLHHRPTRGVNSIAWLVWHLSRWKDTSTATVTGRQSTWLHDGWPARFGLPDDATGYGDMPEQVAAFRASRETLLGYATAAHEAAMERVAAMTPEVLARPFQYRPSDPVRPAWRAMLTNVVDFTEHTGQILYLRGMLTGPDWMK